MTAQTEMMAAESPVRPAAARRAGLVDAPAEAESPSARRLRERLAALDEEARRLSRVLPRAVSLSSQGGGLAEAMAPAVERAMAISGRRVGSGLSAALAPAIGAALRGAIWASIRRSFLALNRFMLRYVSVTGLRWRWEARRQGKTFHQVFLEHTHSLPVKQVFLIHRETGILLQQAQSEMDASRDWDIVSGMLTAIGDFIHDSFSVTKEEQLETIRVGDLTILIEQGKYAALAGVLRGETPEDLRDRFRTALDRIHGQFGHELETFSGETAVFDESSAFLESCLYALVNTDQARILPQTVLVALVLPLLLAVWGGLNLREHRQWRAYVRDLGNESGLVVLREGRHDGRFFIQGLRDPRAPDPASKLSEHGLFVGEVDSRWLPYQSMREILTLPRIRELLKPPDSISVEMDNGMLILRGAAPQEWIDSAIIRMRTLTGLSGYQVDGLVSTDAGDYRRWEGYVQRLEREPGLVVLKSGRRNGRFFVTGLRDPLAREPAGLMDSFGLSAGDVDARWEPYQALHPSLVLERARQVLAPPSGVTLDLRDGVLFAEGHAPFKWIDRAQALAPSVAGIRSLNTGALVDEDLEELRAVQGRIEGEAFRFLVGAPDLWPGQGGRLETLTTNVTRLQQIAQRRNQAFTIEIRGYTDASGDPQRDATDSLDLASGFYENLRFRGMDMSLFTKRGMGSAQPPVAGDGAREAKNRLVALKVMLSAP
ncbi:MAG: hypothetical protein K8T26_13110 [Lentisphaerae bacterium]|nr:hypothetical protein [Lentisphaerota bacterium]